MTSLTTSGWPSWPRVAPVDMVQAALRFARELVAENGDCSTEELHRVGLSDGEMVDIVALVALNIFENYFNMVARMEVDFPKVRLKLKAA